MNLITMMCKQHQHKPCCAGCSTSSGPLSNNVHTSAEWFSRHKKNELAKMHINHESRTIMWYNIPNFDEKKQADLENTHIWVILYYKTDYFCPLKSNFHQFSVIWPNVWVWNSLLPSCNHLLVQVRHGVKTELAET